MQKPFIYPDWAKHETKIINLLFNEIRMELKEEKEDMKLQYEIISDLRRIENEIAFVAKNKDKNGANRLNNELKILEKLADKVRKDTQITEKIAKDIEERVDSLRKQIKHLL